MICFYEAHTVHPSMYKGVRTGDRPYSFVVHSHELYNMGHLYEAAVAYYRATGKRLLLDVAENVRYADAIRLTMIP
jgi:DUF1680 family protein